MIWTEAKGDCDAVHRSLKMNFKEENKNVTIDITMGDLICRFYKEHGLYISAIPSFFIVVTSSESSVHSSN